MKQYRYSPDFPLGFVMLTDALFDAEEQQKRQKIRRQNTNSTAGVPNGKFGFHYEELKPYQLLKMIA
nr:hypothetical protein [uncultured Undibacterium sp.]